MLQFDLLKNHPESIPELVRIWHEVLGSIWVPDVSLEQVEKNLNNHLNEDGLPLTYVAFYDQKPIGMCSLRITDGILPELTPWLGSLVVYPRFQNQGIGKQLIDLIKQKAQQLGFQKLYLFAFDPTIPDYYKRLGWKIIGTDIFKNQPITIMEIS